MPALGRRDFLRASAVGGLAASMPAVIVGCAGEPAPVALGTILEGGAAPLAFDARGLRWALAPREGRIDVLDPDGLVMQTFAELAHPGAVAIDGSGRAWVVELGASRVAVIDLDRGVIARHGADVLHGPRDVAVDGDGSVLIADALAHHVVRFDARGRMVGVLGTAGPGEGELNGPRGVAVDRDGTIVVAEVGGRRVTRMADDGAWLASWGDEGRFLAPRALRIGPDGRIAVADAVRGEVTVHRGDGAVLAEHRTTSLPEAVAFAPDGALWITGPARG